MKTSQAVSQKKAAANRLNAQESTGPRTVEGKNRSKLNAVEHGMRAATTILPTENADAFEARKKAWKAELNEAKADTSEPARFEELPTAIAEPDQASDAMLVETFDVIAKAVAPNEPTEALAEAAQVLAAKEIARPRFKGYRKPSQPPTSALSQVRGYGGAIPLDPARWLADQEYYHNELRNDALYNKNAAT